MPSISGNFDRRKGIIVQIGVAVAGSFDPASNGQNKPIVVQIPALIDTGATNSSLSQAVIKELEIPVVGKVKVQGSSGIHSTNEYRVDLMLIYGSQQMVISNIHVTEINVGADSPFQALLGMDILSSGVLTMSFDGHFTLSH